MPIIILLKLSWEESSPSFLKPSSNLPSPKSIEPAPRLTTRLPLPTVTHLRTLPSPDP
jgi:hypothetical protein